MSAAISGRFIYGGLSLCGRASRVAVNGYRKMPGVARCHEHGVSYVSKSRQPLSISRDTSVSRVGPIFGTMTNTNACMLQKGCMRCPECDLGDTKQPGSGEGRAFFANTGLNS